MKRRSKLLKIHQSVTKTHCMVGKKLSTISLVFIQDVLIKMHKVKSTTLNKGNKAIPSNS